MISHIIFHRFLIFASHHQTAKACLLLLLDCARSRADSDYRYVCGRIPPTHTRTGGRCQYYFQRR